MTYNGSSYAFNGAGDLQSVTSSAGTTSTAYDALRNLTSVHLANGDTIGYVIDGQNRRIAKKRNGVIERRWIWRDALRIAAELDDSGNVVSRFVYATGGNAPDLMIRNDETYELVKDHLGSVRLVIGTADGAVVQQLDYDEFGNVVNDTAPGFQPFGFAGGLYDPDTKLVRFGVRDYDPYAGRWTLKDPVFRAVSVNLYAYVADDPINRVDFSGLEWVYSQSTGDLTHNGTNEGKGYSGNGAGLNNPDKQDVADVGPIPQGTWTIEKQQDNTTGSGVSLPASMRLTPDATTNTFGRSGFLMHGDNSKGDNSASHGCIILNKDIRNKIGSSGDTVLRVIK